MELTQKQIEALDPLEREAKRYEKKIKSLKRRLAFEHAIFYEENISINEEIKELEMMLTDVEEEMSKIIGAKEEMVSHMRKAVEEFNAVEAIKKKWGFSIDTTYPTDCPWR